MPFSTFFSPISKSHHLFFALLYKRSLFSIFSACDETRSIAKTDETCSTTEKAQHFLSVQSINSNFESDDLYVHFLNRLQRQLLRFSFKFLNL